jgi:hypothetical protein
MNRSCDPNAWVAYEGDSSYLVARRGIAAGDEITCDYNINIADGLAWPCRCGAARCRGEVAEGSSASLRSGNASIVPSWQSGSCAGMAGGWLHLTAGRAVRPTPLQERR